MAKKSDKGKWDLEPQNSSAAQFLTYIASTGVSAEKYEIHLSEDVLKANESEIKSIIAHEILHTCFLSMEHNWLWQTYQKSMNSHYGYDIQVKYSWHKILNK